MALVYIEKNPNRSDGKSSNEESTLRCSLCKVLFPVEYGECPSCNMLK